MCVSVSIGSWREGEVESGEKREEMKGTGDCKNCSGNCYFSLPSIFFYKKTFFVFSN